MTINLPKIVVNKRKRVGRGIGSGKGGHTTGRGQKGQKARGKVSILFEGLKMKKSLIKKLPKQRGKGKFKTGVKPIIINISKLNDLAEGTKVDLDLLIKKGIVDKSDAFKYGVKKVGNEKIKKTLEILVPTTK
mgnify:CR=1 FL=1